MLNGAGRTSDGHPVAALLDIPFAHRAGMTSASRVYPSSDKYNG